MRNPSIRYQEKRLKAALSTVNKAHGRKSEDNLNLKSAIKILGKSKYAGAIRPLTYILCNKDRNLRLMAAKALARLGESHWQILIKGDEGDFQRILESDNKHLIKSLVTMFQYNQGKALELKALINSENPIVNQILRDGLNNSKFHDKRFLINILGKLKDAQGVTSIIAFLNHNDAHALAATKSLGMIGDQRAIEPLISKLSTPHGSLRIATAEALFKLGEPQWKSIILGNNEDFLRLGNSGDQRLILPLIEAIPFAGPSAIEGLAVLGNPAAIEPLREVLADEKETVRKAAAEALSKLGDPFWKDLILGDINDFSRLSTSGDPRSVKLLIRLANNFRGLYNHPNMATEALAKVNNPGAVEMLIEAIRNTHNCYEVHINAAKALGRIRNPRSVDTLSEALENLEYDYLFEIIEALGELGSPVAVRYYCGLTRDEDFVVRQKAAKILGELGNPAAIDCLIENLSEHYGEVRVTFAQALAELNEPHWEAIIKGEDSEFLIYNGESDFIRMGKSGDLRAIKPLLKVLNEGNIEYRAEAALALGELGDTKAVEALKQTLCNGFDELRGNAALALAKLGEPQWKTVIKGLATDFFDLRDSGQPWAFAQIIKTCTEGDRDGRYEALAALTESSIPDALGTIIEALEDEDAGVRKQAVETLATFDDIRVLESMIQAMEDEDIHVRLSVIEAVSKLNGPKKIEILVIALDDKQISVRQNAAAALINIAMLDFSEVSRQWSRIKEIIEVPHEDRRYGGVSESSAKCMTHYDTMKHTDTGIGLEIPPELNITM